VAESRQPASSGAPEPQRSGGPPPRLQFSPPAPARPPKAPGAYLRLPLWARLALAAVIAVVLLVAMVLYVRGNNTDSPKSTNPAQAVEANREAEILVEQDQAPHAVRWPSAVAPAAAITQVVRADMERRIAGGAISGPLQRVGCRHSGGSATRQAFSCTILTGSVSYPFLGVVDTAKRRITYCKRDPPPVPSDNIPVSPSCRV
jgi:hypothetical protein